MSHNTLLFIFTQVPGFNGEFVSVFIGPAPYFHKFKDNSIVTKEIVKDDVYAIRKVASDFILNKEIDSIILSGGTGITGSDGTPEAIEPLLDKVIDGFGELFRLKSFEKIKTSSLQSRALAGVANKTFIFVLPGSIDAVSYTHLTLPTKRIV